VGSAGRWFGFAIRNKTCVLRIPVIHSLRQPMQGASAIERMVSRNSMTIQVPDDLARDLERIAATQKKTVEQVTLERLRSLFDAAKSPEAVLRAVRDLPHPSSSAVDDLEAAIAADGCHCTSKAPSTGCHEGDLSLAHERG